MPALHSPLRASATMPGPRTIPVIGNFWNLGRDPRVLLTALARRYGDQAAFWAAGRRYVLFSHPEGVHEVLVRLEHDTIKDDATRRLELVLGRGLLTDGGEHWKTQRRRIAPSFQPRHLAAYVDAMVQSAEERLPTPGEHDIHALLSALTLDVVTRTLFGAEPGGEAARVGPLLHGLMGAFETEQRSLWRMIPDWVPGPHRADVRAKTVELDGLLRALVDRARVDRGDTLLARLLAARDEDGSGMTDAELRDELVTLYLAGHETTAIALAMTLWLLAEHPEHQDAVREELDGLGDRPVTAEDVRRMPVTEAVVKESLRLYSPAWATGRELVRDAVVHGHAIPAGTQLLVSQWVVHRDPRFWIGADAFRPQRWRNGEAERAPRLAYFPFGAGPRVCVGQHFAMLELLVVLATWLRRIRVESLRTEPPALVSAVTLRPRDGLRLGVA